MALFSSEKEFLFNHGRIKFFKVSHYREDVLRRVEYIAEFYDYVLEIGDTLEDVINARVPNNVQKKVASRIEAKYK